MGGAGITLVSGLDGSMQTLVVNGSSVDLSGVTSFSGWSWEDVIEVMLTGAGSGTAVGSSQRETFSGTGNDDTIRGGAGADTLLGGAGRNSYYFATGDVVAGETMTDGDASLRASDCRPWRHGRFQRCDLGRRRGYHPRCGLRRHCGDEPSQ